MTTTQFTTLIFVLLTIVSAGHLSLRTDTSNNFLGSAAQFAVLAGSTITGSGKSNISGSIGVAAGTSITGVINVSGGSIHSGDSVAHRAKRDLKKAYNTLKGMTGSKNLTGRNLGGMTLAPGVYKFNKSGKLKSGTLTLDGQGNSNAQWIFQIGTTLLTSYKTNVKMIGGGNPLNVYWQVGSSATIAAGTTMCGNIIAYASITMKTSARLHGRALARIGGVTLISNKINKN